MSSATSFRFTPAAVTLMRAAYEEGMRKEQDQQFSACLQELKELLGNDVATKERLKTWIMNHKANLRRRARVEENLASVPEVRDETTAPASPEPAGTSTESTATTAPVVERPTKKVTRRGMGPVTPWHLLLKDTGADMRGDVGHREIGAVSRKAATRKRDMTGDEWEQYVVWAAEETAAMTVDPTVTYTPAERDSLIRFHSNSVKSALENLAKLDVSTAGCMYNDGKITNFATGPHGQKAMELMEAGNVHIWRYLSTVAWGTATAQPKTVDSRRKAIRLALLDELNGYREGADLSQLERLPWKELERGCPMKVVSWPEGVPLKENKWNANTVERLEMRLRKISFSNLCGPFISFRRCAGCPVCSSE